MHRRATGEGDACRDRFVPDEPCKKGDLLALHARGGNGQCVSPIVAGGRTCPQALDEDGRRSEWKASLVYHATCNGCRLLRGRANRMQQDRGGNEESRQMSLHWTFGQE